MLPSIFGENLFDDMWDDVFDSMSGFERRNPLYGKHAKNMMKTDVRETESSYELDVDLPGFKKDEIKIDLKNGYLTIAAEKGIDKEIENKKVTTSARNAMSAPTAEAFMWAKMLSPKTSAQSMKTVSSKYPCRKRRLKNCLPQAR